MPRYGAVIPMDEFKQHIADALIRHPYLDANRSMGGRYKNPAEYYADNPDEKPPSADNPIEAGIALLMQLTSKVNYDLLNMVEFDEENIDCEEEAAFGYGKSIAGFHTLSNGIPFLGVACGGDWEFPVFFIIYWDGTELRGYVPKDGNAYNKLTNKAFGNGNDWYDPDDPEGVASFNADETTDYFYLKQHFGEDFVKDVPSPLDEAGADWREKLMDEKLILADIEANILVKEQ